MMKISDQLKNLSRGILCLSLGIFISFWPHTVLATSSSQFFFSATVLEYLKLPLDTTLLTDSNCATLIKKNQIVTNAPNGYFIDLTIDQNGSNPVTKWLNIGADGQQCKQSTNWSEARSVNQTSVTVASLLK